MLTTSGILHLTLASILFNSKYTAANHLTTENVNVSQLENHSVHPDNMFPFIPQETSIRDVAVEIMEEQEEEQEVDEFFENFNENDMVEEESIEKIIENLEGMVQTQANVSQPDLMLQTMGHNNTEQAGVAHLDMGQVPTNNTNVDLANISQEDGILGANFTPELVVGGKCSGVMYSCVGHDQPQYLQCNFDKFILMVCGPGTVCRSNGQYSVYCGYRDCEE